MPETSNVSKSYLFLEAQFLIAQASCHAQGREAGSQQNVDLTEGFGERGLRLSGKDPSNVSFVLLPSSENDSGD